MNLNTLEAALPATMTTDDLLTESEDLVTSIRNAGDSPQDTEIDRLADLLAELASQRSFVNHNGRTLLAAEKEKMVDWYDILTEGSKRFRPKEVMPDTITAPSNAVVQQVSAVIPQDMWLHSKRKPIRQKNQPAGLVDIPKKVTIKPTKKKTDSPQQFTEPVAPYVPPQDKVEVEEETFVPELRTKRKLLQDCDDSVVHFAEDNRTIVLNRTKLITSIWDLFSQYDFDVRQHKKARMYYDILEKKAEPEVVLPKKELSLQEMELAKEREIIEDVMRITKEQRRVFQQELEELEEKNLVALQEVQLERLSLQLTQKGAFDGDTLSDKVLRQIKRQGKKGASKDKKKTSHGESLQEEVTDILTLKELESVPDIDALHEYGEDDDIPDHLPDSFVIGSPVSTLMFLESLPIVAEGKVIVEGKKLKRNDIARYLQKYTKLADVFRLMSEAASYQEHDFDEKKFTEAMHLLFGIVKQEHMKLSVARVLYTVAKEWCGIPYHIDTMYEKMLHDFSAHIDEPLPTSSHTIRRLLRFIAGTSRD